MKLTNSESDDILKSIELITDALEINNVKIDIGIVAMSLIIMRKFKDRLGRKEYIAYLRSCQKQWDANERRESNANTTAKDQQKDV